MRKIVNRKHGGRRVADEKKRIEVSSEVRDAADRCAKKFACLTGDANLCKVEHRVSDEVLFVACLQSGYCSYQRRFGFTGFLCTCPVRKEIYAKYRL